MNTLVMLSGGVDSAAALKYVLQQTTDEVHVHHVHYKNDRDRWEAEAEAVDRICGYLGRWIRGFDRSSSVQDYRELGTFMDIPMLGYTAGLVCRVHTDIDRMVTGLLKSDFAQEWAGGNGPPVRLKTMLDVFKATTDGDPKQRSWWWPLQAWSKAEAIKYVGAELFSMTWSCRMPRWWLGRPSPCGQCKTCQELRACNS